jgi:hypothetical protein
MPRLQDASPDALDTLCTDIYQKTFRDVVRYLARKYPLRPHPDVPAEEVSVPDAIKYKHAPDGQEIDRMMAQFDVPARRHVKMELEDNIISQIGHAVSSALERMSRRGRFHNVRQARLRVTADTITLLSLPPSQA